MPIENENVREENLAGGSAMAVNRTGIMINPELGAQLLQATQEMEMGSANGDELRIQRSEYISEAPSIGSKPEPVDGGPAQRAEESAGPSGAMALLLDKLGERLAFERQGTRLYQAFLHKLEALPIQNGAGPQIEEVRHICEEELAHFKLLQKTIVELGGDATVQSPSADVAGVLAQGALQIMIDPRTTIPQALQAALTAELADNDGWELLRELAEELGEQDLADQASEALEQEQEHLESVRSWIQSRTMAEVAAASGEENEGKPRKRTAKKKSSARKSKHKKKS